MLSTSGFNPEAMFKRLGGNRKLVEELIELFLEEGPRNLESIRDGLYRNDSAAVRIGSHTIRGSLSYFGIDPMMIHLAEQIEKLGRANQLEGVAPLLFELDSLLQLLFEDLKNSPLTTTR
jgi:two-component system sensor histidine kinase/response regulator